MRKRHPARGGAVHCGEQSLLSKSTPNLQPLDALSRHRALVLMAEFGLRPELATMLAALAFEVRP